MKVYYEQTNGDHRSSKIYGYPKESETLDYFIRKDIRDICGEAFEEDAVIVSKEETVKGDLLVRFKTFIII